MFAHDIKQLPTSTDKYRAQQILNGVVQSYGVTQWARAVCYPVALKWSSPSPSPLQMPSPRELYTKLRF